MKRIDFSSEEFRSITWDIDTRLYQLKEALLSAEDAEAEAERLYDDTETDEAWNALNAAIAERRRISHAMDDLRKLSEATYSVAIAFDNLYNENREELKTLGLI